MRKLFLCDTWCRHNPAAIDYIADFCRHIAEDYEGALNGHFGEFLHEGRYADQTFCDRLRSWQRQMPAPNYIRQLLPLSRDDETLPLLPMIRADNARTVSSRRRSAASWPTTSPAPALRSSSDPDT